MIAHRDRSGMLPSAMIGLGLVLGLVDLWQLTTLPTKAETVVYANNRCERDNVNPLCPGPSGASGCDQLGLAYQCSDAATYLPRWCVPMNNNTCAWVFDHSCGRKLDCTTGIPYNPAQDCTETVDWCPGVWSPDDP